MGMTRKMAWAKYRIVKNDGRVGDRKRSDAMMDESTYDVMGTELGLRHQRERLMLSCGDSVRKRKI